MRRAFPGHGEAEEAERLLIGELGLLRFGLEKRGNALVNRIRGESLLRNLGQLRL